MSYAKILSSGGQMLGPIRKPLIILIYIVLIAGFAYLFQVCFPEFAPLFTGLIFLLMIDSVLKVNFGLGEWSIFADSSFAALVHIAPMLVENPRINFDSNIETVGPFESVIVLFLFCIACWIIGLSSLQGMELAVTKRSKVNAGVHLFWKVTLVVSGISALYAALLANFR